MATRAAGGTATTIEEHLTGVDPLLRAELERLRAIVHELAPGLEETISYRVPTLKHMTSHPSPWAVEELADRLSGWDRTEHAIRSTPENPLPRDLVEDLGRVHVRELDAGRQ